MEKGRQKRWLKTAAYGAIVIGLSVCLAYLLKYLLAQFDISQENVAPVIYLVVFGTTLVMNATVLVPVPIATAIMMAAASEWDPILIALVASVGGTLGEISGYYAGYLGKKIAIKEITPAYDRVVHWMDRYGPWTTFVLALQPIIPFDIAGLISGASKLPLWKFLLPCWAGKFPKYIFLCYAGSEIFTFLPGWFQ